MTPVQVSCETPPAFLETAVTPILRKGEWSCASGPCGEYGRL